MRVAVIDGTLLEDDVLLYRDGEYEFDVDESYTVSYCGNIVLIYVIQGIPLNASRFRLVSN